MAEAAFSLDGKYFSAISQDGRLRIWDTETNVLKQEYTPDLHLSSPPICLQWINVSLSSGVDKNLSKRHSNSIEQEAQCIALGTASGKILIYSVTQAKIDAVLTEDKNTTVQNNKVVSLDWHRKFGLYSCSKDNFVLEWDLEKASVRNKYNINDDSKNKQANSVRAIKLIPHTQQTPARYIVAASSQVLLWRLLDGSADIIRNLGHSSAPKALLSLAALNNRCWLIEGSQTERLLAFWDVTITSNHLPQVNGTDLSPTKRKRKKSISDSITPTYNFVLEDAPKSIDVLVKNYDGPKLQLAAVTRSGVVHYYDHMFNGSSSKPIKPSVTIQVTTTEATPLPLQCCRMPLTGDLTIGYLSGATLLFERITPDLKTKTQVLIRGETKVAKKKTNKQTNEGKVKVRNDEKRDPVTYVEPMGGVTRKRLVPGASIEVPMEERLSNLTLDLNSRNKTAVNQNLTKLLVQGLHSNDKELIRTVLHNNKAAVAQSTISALPVQYIPALLEQIALMAARKTSQCESVCTWLNAVIRCHAASLLAALASSEAQTHLTRLMAIFMQRRSHLCQLLNLRGRLELAVTQRKTQRTDETDQQPILQYYDTSDEEMEVEKEQSESENDMWEEDGAEKSAEDNSQEENSENEDRISIDQDSEQEENSAVEQSGEENSEEENVEEESDSDAEESSDG